MRWILEWFVRKALSFYKNCFSIDDMNQIKLISCVFYLCICCAFFQQSIADTHFGILLIVKGDVRIVLSDGTVQKVTAGRKVSEGDKIVVGVESLAKIVSVDRNVLVIGEKSDVVLEKYQQQSKAVSLKINEGSLRSSLKEKYDKNTNFFHISTPTAVAGVRGTDFYVEYGVATKQNIVATFTGKVSYKPNNSKTGFLVEAGKTIRHVLGQDVIISQQSADWTEKILKSHDVTGDEKYPDSSKAVK